MANGKIKVVRCKLYTAISILENVILRIKARKAIEEAKHNTSTEMTENV